MTQCTVVTFNHFQRAVATCDRYHWPGVKMTFILGFFSLLRVSNFTIGEGTVLDRSRHTLIRDCQDKDTAIVLNIKWSKGNQLGSDIISLPTTRSPLYCPVRNWKAYINSLDPSVYQPDSPIFVHQQDNQVFWPSTDDTRVLHRFIWERSGLAAAAYTPHSLRRVGGVPPFSRKADSL